MGWPLDPRRESSASSDLRFFRPAGRSDGSGDDMGESDMPRFPCEESGLCRMLPFDGGGPGRADDSEGPGIVKGDAAEP